MQDTDEAGLTISIIMFANSTSDERVRNKGAERSGAKVGDRNQRKLAAGVER